LPFNLNDSIDPDSVQSNLIGQINGLAAQIKKLIGGNSWKTNPQSSIQSVINVAATQHPGWIPGRYYGSHLADFRDAGNNHVPNWLGWQHFSVPTALTVDAISVYCANNPPNPVNIKLGLYKVEQSLPTQKIIDSGNIAINSYGAKTAIFTPRIIIPGMYAIAHIFDLGAETVSLFGTYYNRHPSAFYYQGSSGWNQNSYINQNFTILNSFELPENLSQVNNYNQRIESPVIVLRAA